MASPQNKKLYEQYNISDLFNPEFYDVTPKTWGEIKEYGNHLPSTFIFRGQSSNKWRLLTTIERAAEKYGYPKDKIWKKEKYIIKEFKARAHHFINQPPTNDEIVEWLSIIQDFGGPTRLLDFTTSFYVALFFSVEQSDSDACIWAINGFHLQILPHLIDHLGEEVIFPLKQEGEEYGLTPEEVVRFAESFIIDPSKKLDLVLQVKPPRLNERLAVQNGLFLCPCNLTTSFEESLCKTVGLPIDTFNTAIPADSLDLLNKLKRPTTDFREALGPAIIKINIPKQLHDEIMRDLYRININKAALFPGLEGFAQSLNNSFLINEPSYNIKFGTKQDQNETAQIAEINVEQYVNSPKPQDDTISPVG